MLGLDCWQTVHGCTHIMNHYYIPCQDYAHLDYWWGRYLFSFFRFLFSYFYIRPVDMLWNGNSVALHIARLMSGLYWIGDSTAYLYTSRSSTEEYSKNR